VHDRDGVVDLRAEGVGDRGGVGVAVRVPVLLAREPDALDEVDRRGRVLRVVVGQRVVEGRAEDRVDADDADAEVAHAGEPAVVLLARGGDLAGLVAGDRGAEVHARPEAGLKAAGGTQLEARALHARGQLKAVLRSGLAGEGDVSAGRRRGQEGYERAREREHDVSAAVGGHHGLFGVLSRRP
jgi:hypothetical protein